MYVYCIYTHTHNTFSEREILAKFAKVILAYNKLIEKEIDEKLEYPLCIKVKSGAYPEDCGGIYGYEEYYSNDEREEINK